MNGYYATEGWLVYRTPWNEADTRVTFFTKDFGRIEVLAKGVRLSKSKLKGHLSTFTRVRLLLRRGKEFWRLLDAEILEEQQSSRIEYCEEFSQFLLGLVVSEDTNEKLWNSLRLFGKLDSPEVLYLLEIETLSALGFLPGEEELKNFFRGEAVAFIAGKRDASFLKNVHEARDFALGIERILEANHMVYYSHGS